MVKAIVCFLTMIACIILVLCLIISGIFLWVYTYAYLLDISNPLRRPVEEIREELLELTPIGSSIEHVIQVVDSNETWEWNGRISSTGYPTDASLNVRVGESSIRVRFGKLWIPHRGFLESYVGAYWGFDEDSNLIDIRAYRQ